MMRRFIVAVALLMAVVTGVTLFPRRAAAIDDLAIIIPAAVGGVVVVVLVIAIIMANRSDETEPDFELVQGQLPKADTPADGLRLAPNCRHADGGFALLCW